MDETTLNSLISQATDALNQQSLALGHQPNTVIQAIEKLRYTYCSLIFIIIFHLSLQTSTGVIQNTQGMLQSNQAIIQTNPQLVSSPQTMMNTTGIIKQQIVQGQAQLVPSQQPVITQQPQSQMISAGQVITNQPNQQVVVQGTQSQFGQMITGNQQIIVGNQQLISGNQIVVGNQQILVSIERMRI